MRTAVIDIGTNTLLLLIVERAADGTLRPIVDLCRFGRLGKGLDASGKLAADAIAKSLDICREYRGVLDEHGVAMPAIVGTQALREASNAAEFIVMTESGILHSLAKISPARQFYFVANENCNCSECPYMRLNTMEKLRDCLLNLEPRVELPEELMRRALVPLERMLAVT